MNLARCSARSALAVVLVLGCGPRAGVPGDASSTTEATGGTPTSSTTGDPLPGTADSTSTSTSMGSDASSSTGCVGEGTAGDGASCDYLMQDCPPGSKCVTIDLDGDLERETLCVPADCEGQPSGTPCTRDEETGVDDCSPTTFCATPFPSDGTGYCVDFCLPDLEAFACADASKICVGSSSEGQYACLPICDPLADECLAGQACLVAYPGVQTTFACYPASAGQIATTGEQCYAPIDGCPDGASCYQCAPGFVCSLPLDYGPGCDFDGTGCCTEYCELDGAPCSNPLHECRPMFGPRAGDNADVGSCDLPDDFDWCDGSVEPPPGFCPPPDADPSYPWCSSFDDSACPGDVVHLGGGQCWCVDPCQSVDECPAPQTASAVPSCDPENGCTLLCDDDSDCPDHMDCFFSDGELRCFWLPGS